MRSAPAALCLVLAELASCGSPPPPRPAGPQPAAPAHEATAWAEPDPEGPALVVGVRTPEGLLRPSAVARGVRLHAEEHDGPEILRFVDSVAKGDQLEFRCRPTGSHSIAVLVAPAGDCVRVLVRDDVSLESRIRELSLDWQLVTPEPVTEAFASQLHPRPEHLAGEAALRLPIAYLGGDRFALAIFPDVDHLVRNRRIPQGLRAEDDLRRLRHGLFAQETAGPDAEGLPGVSRMAGAGIVVQGERLEFAHWLRPGPGAGTPDGLHGALQWLWDHRVRSHAAHETFPPVPAFAPALTEIATTTATLLRSVPVGSAEAALFEADGQHPREARFEWQRQDLVLAHALGALADQERNEDLRRSAGDAVRLLLRAPRRSSLPPARIRLTSDGGRIQTQPAPDGSYSTLDAAWTCYWLLQTRSWLPEETASVGAFAAELGRFLVRSQLESGGFPPGFAVDYLEPLDEGSAGAAADCAAAALFLAELAAGGDAEAEAALWRSIGFLRREGGGAASMDRTFAAWIARLPAGPWTGPPPASSRDLVLSALTAARAAELARDDPRRREAVQLLEQSLSRLRRLQTAWARPWHPDDRVGGLLRTNLDPGWDAGLTALAALAFLQGYESTGHADFLQRGAAALRAALSGRRSDPVAAALALLVTGRVRSRFGDAVFDLPSGTAVGLDALWLEDARASGSTIVLRPLTTDGPSHARIRVLGAIPKSGGYRVECNGTVHSGVSAQELARGLELPVRTVAALSFRPPAEIAAAEPWPASASWHGGLAPDAEAWLQVDTERGSLGRIPLRRAGAARRWVPSEPFIPEGLRPGERLSVYLQVREGDLVRSEPAVGSREVVVGAMHCLDPGDDDEHSLLDPGSSAVAPFPDGREACRLLPPDTAATWAVPVPPDATRLRLQLLLQGSVQVSADDRLLHTDSGADQGPRWLELEASDRRQWQDGTLRLQVRAIGAPVWVGRIRHLGLGHGATVAGEVRALTPVRGLQIAVVPLALDDLPAGAGALALRQAFFGGREYTVTPPPEPRHTAGSAAMLLATLSGGETALQGKVTEGLHVHGLSRDLLVSTAGRQQLAEAVRAFVRGAEPDAPTDLVIAVLGRCEALPLLEPGPSPPAVLFLPERAADGSFLPCSSLLSSLLQAGHGLADLTGPDLGAFGVLDLTSRGESHLSPDMAAVQLAHLGWADRIEVRSGDVQVPALQEDRSFLALPGPGFDRGDLLLEDRRGADGAGPGSGALFAWDLRRAPPVVAAPADTPCRPSLLRLSPDPSAWPTPFHPGRPTDLFRGPVELDGRTLPSLSTPEGEVPWALALRDASPRRMLTIRPLAVPAEDWRRSVWTARDGADTASSPMPVETDLGPVGQVSVRRALRVVPRPGGVLRGELALPARLGPARMFAVLRAGEGAGSTEVRLGAGGEVARAALGPSDRIRVEADLPLAPSGPLSLEVATGPGGGPDVELESCLLLPRQPALAWLVPEPAGVEPWSDGVLRSVALTLRAGPRDRAELLPAPVPAGPALLRLRLGLPAGVASDTVVRCEAALRSRDGGTVVRLLDGLLLHGGPDPVPCTTALLYLPERKAADVMFLELRGIGPDSARVLVQTAEIVRP